MKKILFYSGPSGVGKGVVREEWSKRDLPVHFSVSATTRQPREGEIDGVHYHFLTEEEFVDKIQNGELLEWAEFAGNKYGTLKSEIDRAHSENKIPVLEIEIEGVKQVKEKGGYEHVGIWLMPPSTEELERRLRGRGTEKESDIQKRLSRALEEIEIAEELFDYLVEADGIKETADKVEEIIIEISK